MKKTKLVNKWIGTGMLHGIITSEEREKLCHLLENFIQLWYKDSQEYLTGNPPVSDAVYGRIPWAGFRVVRALHFANVECGTKDLLDTLVKESFNYPKITAPHNIDDEAYLYEAVLEKFLPKKIVLL